MKVSLQAKVTEAMVRRLSEWSRLPDDAPLKDITGPPPQLPRIVLLADSIPSLRRAGLPATRRLRYFKLHADFYKL